MSEYPHWVQEQLKNITKQKFIKALEKDGFKIYRDRGHSSGSVLPYIKPSEDPLNPIRVDVHLHDSGETYGLKLILRLLKSTNWSVDDLIRLKLIKKR